MKKANILVVDDDRDILELLREILSDEGMEVFIAANEHDCFKLLNRQKINLVILDMLLEHTTGIDILEKFRNIQIDLPVIILSNKNKVHSKIMALGAGADDYMTKPFDEGELIARIKAHLRRYPVSKDNTKSDGNCISINNLKLDLNSFRLFKNEEEITLSTRCIRILQLFMKNPHQVFTKEQIYTRVWDDDYFDENTVMVYISELRKKIENDPRKPQFIHTVRGVGYKFIS